MDVASVTSPFLMGCFEALHHGQFLELHNQKNLDRRGGAWVEPRRGERVGATEAVRTTPVNQEIRQLNIYRS